MVTHLISNNIGGCLSFDKSSFLHLLRWVSALFVLIEHAQIIGGGDRFFLAAHAHAAVIIFFVLSGYVIASVVERNRQLGLRLGEYLIDRFSRIYSVLMPAIIFTILLDSVGSYLFPARYLDSALLPQDNYIIRILINSLSLQGLWGYRVQLGSNPALWSIGYEFYFYILFGLLTWRVKYWFLFFIIVVLIVGPKIVIYSSIWLLGVIAYKVQKILTVNFTFALVIMFVANLILHYSPPSFILSIPEFFRDFLFGVSVMFFLLSNPKMPKCLIFTEVNKGMANFSFSAYAYHYPIMFFLYSFLPQTNLNLIGVIIFSLLVARIFFEFTEKRRGLISVYLKDKL